MLRMNRSQRQKQKPMIKMCTSRASEREISLCVCTLIISTDYYSQLTSCCAARVCVPQLQLLSLRRSISSRHSYHYYYHYYYYCPRVPLLETMRRHGRLGVQADATPKELDTISRSSIISFTYARESQEIARHVDAPTNEHQTLSSSSSSSCLCYTYTSYSSPIAKFYWTFTYVRTYDVITRTRANNSLHAFKSRARIKSERQLASISIETSVCR